MGNWRNCASRDGTVTGMSSPDTKRGKRTRGQRATVQALQSDVELTLDFVGDAESAALSRRTS
jgi:hypothetical protein